jgi:hypothetical protein
MAACSIRKGPALYQLTEKAASSPTHRMYLEAAPVPDSVPQARRHARAALAQWGLDRIAADAELVASELVTNAITASAALPSPAPVCLHVAAYPGYVLVVVCDASPAVPVRGPRNDDAPAGRGLQIIETLSLGWGYRPCHLGKIVWASLPLGDD